jgi:UDP-N-acetylmuramoylalanine--D-glutamate ligase
MAAIIACKILGVENELIQKALREFKSLPHRIENVGTFKGITFYDDSISTIPEATIAALQALGPDVETLIIGGHDRGIDFSVLVNKLPKTQVKNLILFPESGQRIWKAVAGSATAINHFFVQDMKEAVNLAFTHTSQGKICLLSPASPSFGLFKDYQDRGNQFKELARNHG